MVAMQHRNTKQRNIILKELRGTKAHPSAYALFRMVKKRSSGIGFATVYRNLNILKEEGSILELLLGKYGCRYDGNMDAHDHAVCISCQKVFDIPISSTSNVKQKLCQIAGFDVKYRRINFYGYCNICKRCKNKKKDVLKKNELF